MNVPETSIAAIVRIGSGREIAKKRVPIAQKPKNHTYGIVIFVGLNSRTLESPLS
jgi:hypothetical protein